MTQLELINENDPSGPVNGFDLIAQIFNYEGHQIRTVVIGGKPWLVVPDILAVLGVGNSTEAVRSLDDDEFSTTEVVDSAGRRQPNTYIVNEPGFYSLVMRSRKAKAKAFKRWVIHEVLPALSRTGRYELPAQRELSDLEIAERHLDAVKARLAAETRAELAEAKVAELEPAAENWEQIQGGTGIVLTSFRKKYFGKVPERSFFEHLYARGYLIDQRGTGSWSESRKRHRDGWQHRHPTAKGGAYLYLHTVNDRAGERRENVRVLSGEPELALRDALTRDGLAPNIQPATKEIES